MLKAVCREVIKDLASLRVQQRPDDPASLPRDAPQAGGAAAAAEVHQHRLAPVPGVVRRGDAITAKRIRALFQKRIAQLARGLLDAEPLRGGISGHIHALHCQRYGEPVAEGAHKVHIPQRFLAAQSVLAVGGKDRQLPLARRFCQQVQQADRVRPAREGAEHAAARRQQRPINIHLPCAVRPSRRRCTPAARSARRCRWSPYGFSAQWPRPGWGFRIPCCNSRRDRDR